MFTTIKQAILKSSVLASLLVLLLFFEGGGALFAFEHGSEAEHHEPSVLLTLNPAAANNGGSEGSSAAASSGVEHRFGLSDETFELARSWGLLSSLKVLDENPAHLSNKQMDVLLKRLVVRQEVNEAVMSKMFDVRITIIAIDKQIARTQEIRAILAEKRDKAIRFNTYADLVAGGITGILSSALRLGTLEFITPDVVDLFEGVAQTGLAGYALKNENVKHHMEKGIPNLLAKMFYPDSEGIKEFPDSVWQYLNAVPANSRSKLSRREELVKRWTDCKFCLRHDGHRLPERERVKHATGLHKRKVGLTIDLLEDRAAMLQDLRSEVTNMEEYLAEIFQRSKKY